MSREGIRAARRRLRIQTPFTLAFTVFLLVGAPNLVEACSVCFGNPDSPHTKGMNNAILFLLAVIVAVLVCFAAFFFHLRRMSRLASANHGMGSPGRMAPGDSPGRTERPGPTGREF